MGTNAEKGSTDRRRYIHGTTPENLVAANAAAKIDFQSARVLERERAYIQAWRAGNGRDQGRGDAPLTGLAVSGGGIRSATFALGVTQALAAHDLMRRFDYLSTVSGGGYLG